MFIHHYENTRHRQPNELKYVAAFESYPKNEIDIRRWCYQAYGAAGLDVNNFYVRWIDHIKYGEIEFALEEDLTLFLLRWS